MAKGDHLFVQCTGYSHHGIDIGSGRVIHFDFRPWQAFHPQLAGGKKPGIRETPLEEFSQGRPVHVRHYVDSVSADLVVERAKSRVGDLAYHLMRNNCEHFAVWCKTGTSHSTQVADLLDATVPFQQGVSSVSVAVGAFARRYFKNRQRSFARGES